MFDTIEMNVVTLLFSLQSLQTKQLNLLSRLDELDQECTSLGEELRDVKGSRDQLMGEVEKIRKECVVLKNQLEEQEVSVVSTLHGLLVPYIYMYMAY